MTILLSLYSTRTLVVRLLIEDGKKADQNRTSYYKIVSLTFSVFIRCAVPSMCTKVTSRLVFVLLSVELTKYRKNTLFNNKKNKLAWCAWANEFKFELKWQSQKQWQKNIVNFFSLLFYLSGSECKKPRGAPQKLFVNILTNRHRVSSKFQFCDWLTMRMCCSVLKIHLFFTLTSNRKDNFANCFGSYNAVVYCRASSK